MTPTPKTVCLFSASFTNAATATGNVDTRGYDYAVLELIEQASNNTTNNCSVLNLLEDDTTVASNFATVSGFVGDTDFTIPASVTSGTQVVAQFRMDLRGRQRYIRMDASPVTTQVLTGIAHLYRADEAPVSATNAGVGVLVEG